MSLSRFGLVAMAVTLTMIGTDWGVIGAQFAHGETPVDRTATAPVVLQAAPAPCCGTITGDS